MAFSGESLAQGSLVDLRGTFLFGGNGGISFARPVAAVSGTPVSVRLANG